MRHPTSGLPEFGNITGQVGNSRLGWRRPGMTTKTQREHAMHKTVAIVVLAAGLAACGVIDTLVDGFKYAKAVETDLERETGLRPGVGFNWSNGRLTSVSVTFPRLIETKPVRELADTVRRAVAKEFKQTPENIVLALSLRQAVGDGEPRRLGADEDVRGRTDGRIIDKGSHGDVDEGAVADGRIEQRAAPITVRVVVIGVAKDHELVLALAEAQPVARNAGERLERRPRRPPAVRTMAVRGVSEFVRHRVMDRAAQALSRQHTAAGLFRICHGLLPSHLPTHPRSVIDEFMAKFKTGQALCILRGGQTVSHDRSSVEAVVQHYFDALYEGDADKLGAVFHPSADLRSLEKGELKVLTMPVLVRLSRPIQE